LLSTEAANNLTSHPRILALRNSFDVKPFIQSAASKISSLRMPEQYAGAIYGVRERASKTFADVMNMAAMQHVTSAGNQIYQEV
jgi:hypothetical protein